MKMTITLCAAALVVGLAGSAHALTAFQDVVEFGEAVALDNDGEKISNAKKYSGATFSFNGITNQFVATGDSVPILSLSMPKSSKTFVDRLYVKVGSEYSYLGNITATDQSVTFSADKLALLNQAIRNESVEFRLAYGDGGKSYLAGASIQGTMAPEPASMALVAAGLIAIPFARRMRKSFMQKAA